MRCRSVFVAVLALPLLATAAQADLKKAEAVAPKAAFVARNLTALQSHAALVQVSVAPKS